MANEYLKRQPTSTGNRKVFTWSGWVKTTKESKSGNGNDVFFCASSNDTGSTVYHRTRIGKFVQDPHDFGFNHYDGANDNYSSEADFRDFSSWSHYLCSVDTTKEQTTDRVKLYVNGAHINDLQTVTAINQNLDTFVNGLTVHYLGADGWTASPNTPAKISMFDVFMVDGQALTPDVFGFYKDGKGYQSSGTTQATDFRPGQWSPHSPRKIKTEIERKGGFGVNGFYLPMNDSSNFGADFHTTPNSIITLKGEDLPQPRNGAPTTSDAYVSQLRQETGSLGFDGVVKFDGSGDYLSLADNADCSFDGDFTIEAFVYPTAFNSFNTIFSTEDLDFKFISSGVVRIYTSSGSNTTGTIPLNRWSHVALVRQSSTFKVYINGNGETVTPPAFTGDGSSAAEIGRKIRNTSEEFTGFISNLRVVKGTAVYTSNFTVPTEALTNVTNTKLLCCNSSTSATASTVTPATITANGGAFATRNELSGSIVLAVPGISTATGSNLITNGSFDTDFSGWSNGNPSQYTYTYNSVGGDTSGKLMYYAIDNNVRTFYQYITCVSGERYTLSFDACSDTANAMVIDIDGTNVKTIDDNNNVGYIHYNVSFTAGSTSVRIRIESAAG